MSLFDFRFELQAQSRVVLELDEPRESITWNRIGDNDVFENGELNQVCFNPLSLEDCRRNFYNYNMFRILVSCSVRKDESEDEWEEYKKQLLDYINENFALFNEVVSTKIEDTPNETISAYEFWDLVSSRLGISKLWRQIYLGRKKVGDKVKSYFDFENYLPEFVKKVVRINKNGYVRRVADASRLEYKLGLFSVFLFLMGEECGVMELKCRKYYELHAK